jgi:predicted aspartyl protease
MPSQFQRLAMALLPLCAATLCGQAAHAGCTVKSVATLAVTTDYGRPVTKGEINGHPVSFMIDSGSFYSFLSKDTARDTGLSLKAIPASFQIQGIGGEIPTGRAYIEQLKLSTNSTLLGVNFLVGGIHGELAGLIGQNILGRQDVEYDLAHGTVRFLRAENCLNGNPAYWAAKQPYFTMPIEAMAEIDQHTMATISVNGVKMRAMFDTGAGASFISLKAARKLNVRPSSKGVEKGEDVTGLNGKSVESYRARFDSIEIGGEKFNGVTLSVLDNGDGYVDMVVGTDFFMAHRIYVANELHRMIFTYSGGDVFGVAPSSTATTQ